MRPRAPMGQPFCASAWPGVSARFHVRGRLGGLSLMTKNGNCRICKCTTEFQLTRQLFINGSEHFVWVCSSCQIKNPSGGSLYIESEKVMAHLSVEQISNLPVLMPELYNRCAVCGSRGAELHHWAPKHLFGDEAEKWPKDHLCKVCHDRWHNKVTPDMAGGFNGPI